LSASLARRDDEGIPVRSFEEEQRSERRREPARCHMVFAGRCTSAVPMSPRSGADERLRRLLALVPWVATHDGPHIEDVCARFGTTERELLDDLDLLFLVGVHPFDPGSLIEVDVDEGRVWIRFADWFARPLRLTPAEGLSLVASG